MNVDKEAMWWEVGWVPTHHEKFPNMKSMVIWNQCKVALCVNMTMEFGTLVKFMWWNDFILKGWVCWSNACVRNDNSFLFYIIEYMNVMQLLVCTNFENCLEAIASV